MEVPETIIFSPGGSVEVPETIIHLLPRRIRGSTRNSNYVHGGDGAFAAWNWMVHYRVVDSRISFPFLIRLADARDIFHSQIAGVAAAWCVSFSYC